ncbi:YdbH domain-containing protein [Henriciella sp. AS95]|uniref:intermembrane phospholipid transport protein YdbH family protein n=1 Tax=Henriciella sp. AS95 TaxID=3135782 RepID=UPI00317D7A6E
MQSHLLNWRKWQFWLGLVVLLLVLTLVSAWLLRVQIAQYGVRQWCQSQSLTCSASISDLGFSRIRATSVSVKSATDEVPFEAEEAVIALDWPGLFKPAVKSVELRSPILRGTYSEDAITFGGLEKFASGESSSAAAPSFNVRDARIELMTPAGPVAMTGEASGQMPLQVDLQAEIEPVELETDGNRLDIREGSINLSIVGLKIAGQAEFELAEATFDTLEASDIKLSANMEEGILPAIDWSASASAFERPGLSLSDAEFAGTLSLANPLEKAENASWLSRIKTGTAEGSVRSLKWLDNSADAIELTLETERADSKLKTNYGLIVSGVDRPDVTADELTLSGDATSDDTFKTVDARGDLSFKGVSIPPAYRADLLSSLQLGGPFEAHSAALRRALSDALVDVGGGTGFKLTLEDGGYWSVVSTRAMSIKSADGTHLAINPQNAKPALNVADEGVELAGLVTLDGPHVPKLVVDLSRASLGSDLTIETGGVTLSPWTAGGLTLSSDLNEVHFERADGTPRLQAVGELRVDGKLYGQDFAKTRVFGGIDAAGGSSLRVQTLREPCLGFDTQGIRTGADYAIEPVSLQLCPRDGRVVRPVAGGSAGTIDLGAVKLPFRGESTSGTLSLQQAVLDWSATSTARLDLKGQQMSLPLQIGEKTLIINSTEPEIALTTTSPVALNASTGASTFSGTLVPADISLDQLTLSATLPSTGIEGDATATGVEVRDRGEDPLYLPLRGDLSAIFDNGIMQLSGPITTRPAGQKIADVNLELDILALDGTASVITPDLTFMPRGFQPTALSDRVRGFLSNARGTLKASAEFVIAAGSTTGTGWVSAEDFGFDTLRLGAVNDVNGRIEFDDIMQLTTPPGQEIRIGQISPGIPLRDGRIRFQLNEGLEATIEDARWPFAGGEIFTGGSSWTIAGTRDVIEITASALELAQIVSIFDLPDVKAQGTVTGSFPVEIIGPNTFIRNATLTADSEGGTIAYTGDVGDAAAAADERVSMAFDALKDFRFSVLEIGADGNLSGDILITMRLVGKSPEVLDGAPFAFNIGIDSKLMQLIRTGRSITSSDWLADVAAESVKNSNTADTGSAAPEQ